MTNLTKQQIENVKFNISREHFLPTYATAINCSLPALREGLNRLDTEKEENKMLEIAVKNSIKNLELINNIMMWLYHNGYKVVKK